MKRWQRTRETTNLEIPDGRASSNELCSPKIEDDQISKLQNLNQILLNEIKSLRDEKTILSDKSKKVEKDLRKELANEETEHEASISKVETQLQEAQHKIQAISAESEATRKAWELEKAELLSQIAAARKEIEAIPEELVRKNEQARVAPTAKPWLTCSFQPLDMTALPGYPDKMPDGFNIWLPKFSGNKVITAEEHIDKFCNYMAVFNINEEDVVMTLFALSLEGVAFSWFTVSPDKEIKSWEQCRDCFIKRWTTRKNKTSLITEFSEIEKTDLENVHEFNQIFYSLLKVTPNNIRPLQQHALLKYLWAFDGELGFALRNRCPTTLAQARDNAIELVP